MDRLKKVFEFLAPSTPTGFLFYGWFGSFLAAWASAVVTTVTGSWLLGTAVVLAIWFPLWLRASRLREEGYKLQRIVNEIHNAFVQAGEEDHRQAVSKEEDGTAT